jgi:hypothetical protein
MVSLVSQDAFLQDAVETVVHAPGGLDVAIAFVRDHVASKFVEVALPTSQLENRPERRIPTGSLLVAAGFPEQFTYDAHHPAGWVQHRFVDILNYTSDFRHDHRFISIGWKEGEMVGHDFPFDEVGVPRGATIPLKKPTGLSGGPVFLIRATRKNEIWSLGADASLIGVSIEFKNRRELALPWWRWASWVQETMG